MTTTGVEQRGRLLGKRTIVTGAGNGIGQAAAKLFAAEGAMILAVDRDGPAVAATVAAITQAGGTAIAYEADVATESGAAGYVARAVEAFGGLDAVHANAGIGGGRVPLLEQTAELWQELLRVNLIGPFLAIKYTIPHLTRQGKGAIVCTSSVAGFRAGAAGSAYSASKAGIINLVQTTACSLHGAGIRVNAVCPGPVETEMTRPSFALARERGYHDELKLLNPLQRFGTPEEIAAVALFLLSDDSSFINGQAVVADGGWSSSLPFAVKRT
jgi:NAD(P)-dependent dehydrogenase (short-subunit alcohol dehydrogenase family)